MCFDCRLAQWSWPEDWPHFDLTVPDELEVPVTMAMTYEDLQLCGGP